MATFSRFSYLVKIVHGPRIEVVSYSLFHSIKHGTIDTNVRKQVTASNQSFWREAQELAIYSASLQEDEYRFAKKFQK